MSTETVEYIRELRGIPLWLLQEYLVELGGEAVDHQVLGAGWKASLQQLEDYRLGSIRVGQVRLEIRADTAAFELLKPHLEKKLLRAGG